MDERVWRFEFVDSQQTKINDGIGGGLGSGINEKPNSKADKNQEQFIERFNDKITGDILRTAIGTPLNSAVGKIASPIYNAGKRVVHGQAMGKALGTLGVQLAVIGVQELVTALETRLQEIQQKVNDMGNTDNALIRAGSVSKATYYEGNVFGVKRKTDRS